MTDINFEQSALERQNVLNNQLAVNTIIKNLDIKGFIFEGELKFTRKAVTDYLEIDDRTIVNYLANFEGELKSNGYLIYKGQKLKEIKEKLGTEIDFGSKTTQLGLFNFKAFLNLSMLLKEGNKAREIRSLILNIVIGVDHDKLDAYLAPMDVEDFERFLHNMDLKEIRDQKRQSVTKSPKLEFSQSKLSEEEFDEVIGGVK